MLLDDVQDSQTVLIEETKQAHHLLIELQNVLLSGQEDSVDESMEINENTTNYEQVCSVVLMSTLELSRFRNL